MKNLRRWLRQAGGLMIAGLYCGQLSAAIVHLPGDTVDFYYDDAQPGIASYYGSLFAVGDSIIATPIDFFAESTNGIPAGPQTLNVVGTVVVVAKPGYEFTEAQVAQQGDYTLQGAGAAVSASAVLDVTDSNNSLTTVSSPLVSTDDYTLPGTNNWSSFVSVDLSTAMWSGVNSIELELDATLSATTAANGELARIENKLTGGGLMTIMTVPVPPAIWLFATGLLMLVRAGRKRQ